ncbi:MAG: DAK2 domain-containing protein [Oscillospiraceae bacterium]|nr:DAK2 domain-containing protein [Oscillospiraceae bacterium]
MIHSIDGIQFKQMVLHGSAAIHQQMQKINDLNVFPVPDGDTGTNMSLTIAAAATELKKSEPASISQAASVTASALLRGARGNSGVILSLLFRGIGKALKGHDTADGAIFAAALQEGVGAAYGAVMKPAEGTVLTVSRLASKRAVEAAAENNDVEFVLVEAIREGYDALAKTTDMNPVLKKAGVVDAGGQGYLVILEGMLSALRGEPMPEVADEQTNDKADFASLTDEDITFTFDTVFIVRKNDPNVDLSPLRAYLSSIGDSLVIGEDDDAFKVHVHTDIPGNALNEAQKFGTLELAKIENMRTQYEDMAAGRKTHSADDLDNEEHEMPHSEEPAPAVPTKRYGFLSVCTGDGIASVFRDLGADGIISGGQTMNPSTESILKEIEKVPAEVVFVLPNNKNIVMAAQQCVGLTEKEVVVVPTHTIPQGVSAMMAIDPDLDKDELLETMTGAFACVATAQITYAARNSDFDGFNINEGDYLGLLGGKLFGTDKEIDVLLKKFAEEANNRSAEFVTIFYGENVTEEQAQQASDLFTELCPNAEVSLIPGGQPVYYYIISIEG